MRPLLARQELLTAAPAWAERVYVGKRGGTASIRQPQIDELLVTLCQQVRG
jgi:siroheme synthase